MIRYVVSLSGEQGDPQDNTFLSREVKPEDAVIKSVIEMTERIANSRSHVLALEPAINRRVEQVQLHCSDRPGEFDVSAAILVGESRVALTGRLRRPDQIGRGLAR